MNFYIKRVDITTKMSSSSTDSKQGISYMKYIDTMTPTKIIDGIASRLDYFSLVFTDPTNINFHQFKKDCDTEQNRDIFSGNPKYQELTPDESKEIISAIKARGIKDNYYYPSDEHGISIMKQISRRLPELYDYIKKYPTKKPIYFYDKDEKSRHIDDEKSSTARSEESTSETKRERDEKENKKRSTDEINIGKILESKFMSVPSINIDTLGTELLTKHTKTDIICIIKKCAVIISRVDLKFNVWYGWNGKDILPIGDLIKTAEYLTIHGERAKVSSIIKDDKLVEYGFCVSTFEDLVKSDAPAGLKDISFVSLDKPLVYTYLETVFKDNPTIDLFTGTGLYNNYSTWRACILSKTQDRNLIEKIHNDIIKVGSSYAMTLLIDKNKPSKRGCPYRTEYGSSRWKIRMDLV